MLPDNLLDLLFSEYIFLPEICKTFYSTFFM